MLRLRMWIWLYGCLTWTLLGVAFCALPLLNLIKPKFAKWFRMRFWPRPLDFQPQFWMHAVSMGEIKIARAVLDDFFKMEMAPDNFLITCATQQGYHSLIEAFGRERVRYLPWDARLCYRRLFGNKQVPNLIVVETEIWPVLFSYVREQGADLVVINGRLGSKTMRISRNPLFRKALAQASFIAARGDADRERYLAFGVEPERVTVTGNIKFDFEPKKVTDPTFLTWLEDEQPLLVFASISTDEVDLLAPAVAEILAMEEGPRILWAPRHLKDLEIHRQALASHGATLRSELDQNSGGKLLILDSFGELSGCYPYALLSLVGGSFNRRGGQNFLESLQAGAPALMGPFTENFQREVKEALQEQTIEIIAEPGLVGKSMADLVRDPERLQAMSERARTYLARHAGAIARTRKVLIDLDVFTRKYRS